VEQALCDGFPVVRSDIYKYGLSQWSTVDAGSKLVTGTEGALGVWEAVNLVQEFVNNHLTTVEKQGRVKYHREAPLALTWSTDASPKLMPRYADIIVCVNDNPRIVIDLFFTTTPVPNPWTKLNSLRYIGDINIKKALDAQKIIVAALTWKEPDLGFMEAAATWRQSGRKNKLPKPSTLTGVRAIGVNQTPVRGPNDASFQKHVSIMANYETSKGGWGADAIVKISNVRINASSRAGTPIWVRHPWLLARAGDLELISKLSYKCFDGNTEKPISGLCAGVRRYVPPWVCEGISELETDPLGGVCEFTSPVYVGVSNLSSIEKLTDDGT
jgi:hypothetical protein